MQRREVTPTKGSQEIWEHCCNLNPNTLTSSPGCFPSPHVLEALGSQARKNDTPLMVRTSLYPTPELN